MARTMFHGRNAPVFAGFLFLILVVSSSMAINVTAQESLNLSLDRNFGMALGGLIQGTFTLRCNGPEAVENLTVFFNGEQVHFVTGNTLSWQFNTGDYSSGATNITVFGLDDQGTTYIGSRQVTFLGGMASTLFTVGILAFVVVVIILRYAPKLRRSQGE